MLQIIFSLATLWWMILFLYIPACFGLIIIVLMQRGKGQGLAGAFGMGGGMDTIFGPRSSKSLPQKITYASAGVFMTLALIMSILSGRVGRSAAPDLVAEAPEATMEALFDPAETPEGPVSTVDEEGEAQAVSGDAPSPMEALFDLEEMLETEAPEETAEEDVEEVDAVEDVATDDPVEDASEEEDAEAVADVTAEELVEDATDEEASADTEAPVEEATDVEAAEDISDAAEASEQEATDVEAAEDISDDAEASEQEAAEEPVEEAAEDESVE